MKGRVAEAVEEESAKDYDACVSPCASSGASSELSESSDGDEESDKDSDCAFENSSEHEIARDLNHLELNRSGCSDVDDEDYLPECEGWETQSLDSVR